MFKAVHNLKSRKGFTLIELLIVIAIIGILAAIAIPAFLGQREKAKQRSVEASCRGMLAEVQASLDDYSQKRPMLLQFTPSSQKCYHYSVDTTTQRCQDVYPGITSGTYSDYTEVMSAILTHHNIGKAEKSPYKGTGLVVVNASAAMTVTPTPGFVELIGNAEGVNAGLYAWSDTTVIVCNIPVSAR